jgi:putative flavoprotein involved in K+ transport
VHSAKLDISAPTEERYVAVWRPDVEPTSLDLAAAGVTSVIWAVGFRSNFGWLKVPVFDGEGQPCHDRGITAVDGLYFLGLPRLHTWGSGRFARVQRDAEHLVEHVAARSRTLQAASI